MNEDTRRIKNPKTRRKHTAVACIRCWKAKTRCSIKRPCDRCIRIGCNDCSDRPASSRRKQNINTIPSTNNKKSKAKSKSKKPKAKPKAKPKPKPKPKPKKKPKQKKISKKEILNSISLPKSYRYTHTLPESMTDKFNKPILSELGNDKSFTYLPIISRYQISEKSYCELCFGLLESYHNGGNELHLSNPHNYPCPNTMCDREFVLPSHLSIHLKICKESAILIEDCRGLNDSEFKEWCNYKIETPINGYYNIIKDEDINGSKEWIKQQIEWREKRKSKSKRNTKKKKFVYAPPKKRRKIVNGGGNCIV